MPYINIRRGASLSGVQVVHKIHTRQEGFRTCTAFQMSEGLLHGHTALITGASKGIGKAIAVGFAQHGANVILVARKEAGMAEVTTVLYTLPMYVFTTRFVQHSDQCQGLLCCLRRQSVLFGADQISFGVRQVAGACRAAGSGAVELREMDASSKESVTALAKAVEGKVACPSPGWPAREEH
jgi:NAD(P)-dependent dehydrogenase (short-subunit alcohol dehydrogenase family)